MPDGANCETARMPDGANAEQRGCRTARMPDSADAEQRECQAALDAIRRQKAAKWNETKNRDQVDLAPNAKVRSGSPHGATGRLREGSHTAVTWRHGKPGS